MPFSERLVVPVPMSCAPVPVSVTNELECVSNRTLCNAMRQLSSLLKLADDIFADLHQQCGDINKRTDSIKVKMTRIQDNIDKFNPKKAKIREYLKIISFRTYKGNERV